MFVQHGGAVVNTVALQQEGSGFNSGSGCFCVEFSCSACVGFLWILQPPSTVQGRGVRLIYHHKWPVDVILDGRLSLFVSPVMD